MDDERIVLEVVSEMFEVLGHEVEKVCNGNEAILAYQRALDAGRRFDLVILDLTIPGAMGGREAVRQLRQIDPEVQAVVSSGYASDSSLSDYKSLGFSGVLSKPYTLHHIEKLLAGL